MTRSGWGIATGVVGAVSLATLIGGYAYLVVDNSALRQELSASHANAETLYQQIIESGEKPDGENPDKVTGIAGPQGIPGLKGERGDRGPIGPIGQPGMPGMPGAQGIPGPQGEPGEDGADGAPGPQGEPGATGAQGAQGEPGASGVMETWSYTVGEKTYVCTIDGTPPPYTYTCTAEQPPAG